MILLDRKSIPWAIGSAIFLILSTSGYIIYVSFSPDGPRGGSIPGLIFGSVGSAMMLIALFLGVRKYFRTAPLGKAYNWMQAHIWLGLLSYPVILFHAGFSLGGTLTQVLVWLFLAVWGSGIVGLLLQQFLPGKMFRDMPMETIFDQIGHVLDTLRGEAEQCIEAAVASEQQAIEALGEGSGGTAVAMQIATAPQRLHKFYEGQVLPFLGEHIPRGSVLAVESRSAAVFSQLRTELPAELQETLTDLQSIVDERRQLENQRRLHAALHLWLFVHVPLSYALIILSTAHAIVALKYSTLGS